MTRAREAILERGGRSNLKLLAALIIGLLAFFALLVNSAQPAKATLTAVSPGVDPDTNFPFWYQDANGLRLEPCLAGLPNCSATPADLAPPDGEGFYALYNATAGKGSWEGALEFAYLDAGPGQEITFSRFRFVAKSGLEPGADYTVTHPYGTDTYQADGDGAVKPRDGTEDIGCAVVPCNFSEAMTSRFGPFLTWDTFGQATGAPPAGYIGDGVTPHAVVGSPTGNNFVRIEGPNINDNPSVDACPTVEGDFADCVETDLFTVEGKVHGVTAFATPEGGTFNANKSVSLTASDPAAEIRYTTDPAVADADIATSGTVFDPASPISITGGATGEATTVLRFVAIDPATAQPSPVRSETYNIDTVAPGAPTSNVDPKLYNSAQHVSLSAEAGAEIHYTTNGSNPTASSPIFHSGTPIDITNEGLTTLKAIAIDKAGNVSDVASFEYRIDTTRPNLSADKAAGSYDAGITVNLSSEAGANIFYTTNGSDPSNAGNADRKSALGSASVAVNSTQTLRAIAVDEAGNASSPELQRQYIIREPSQVLLELSKQKVKFRKSLQISGSVSPAHEGTVKVAILRNGRLIDTKTLDLANSNFGFVYRPPLVGSYSVNATFPKDADHLGDTSDTLSFRVVR